MSSLFEIHSPEIGLVNSFLRDSSFEHAKCEECCVHHRGTDSVHLLVRELWVVIEEAFRDDIV